MFRVLAAVCCIFCSIAAYADKPLQVVTSIQPLALIAKALLPENTEYRVLVPKGGNPHSYALKVSDRQAIAEADLVLWVGPDMERFLAKVIARSDSPSIAMADLPGIYWPENDNQNKDQHKDHAHGHEHHDHGGKDMHLWLNPDNAISLIVAVGNTIAVDSAQAVADMRALNEVVSKRLQRFESLKYAVYHDAYGHFIDRYQVPEPVVLNPSDEGRPGARHLLKVRKQLKGGDCLLVAEGQENSLSRQVSLSTGAGLVAIEPLEAESYEALIMDMAEAFIRCGQTKTAKVR